jgi:hypothetical protein
MTPAIILAALSMAAPVAIVPPGTTPAIVTISFSGQGAEALRAMTGKRVRGVGLESVVTCSTGTVKLPAGRIYQLAIQHGISPIDPDVAESLIKRKVGFSIFNILPSVLSDGTGGIAVLGAAKVIAMSSPWLVGLTAASATINLVEKQIQSHAPDPAPLFKLLLDPANAISFAEAGCSRAMMVVRYKGRKSDNSDGTWTIQ